MKKLILNILLLIFSITGFSQEINYTKYTIDDGLSQSQIISLCTDSKQRIWSGTYGGGISVFDGKEFTTYNKESGLSSNYIYSLYKDSQSRIWIGTDEGLSVYDNNEFVNYPLMFEKENNIYTITEDEKQDIFIGTNKGIYKVNDDKLEFYTTNSVADSVKILKLFIDSKENLWIGTQLNGLIKYSSKEILVFNKKSGLPYNNVRVIIENDNNDFFIGTDKGACLINNDKIIYTIGNNKGESLRQTFTDGFISNDSSLCFVNYNGWAYFSHIKNNKIDVYLSVEFFDKGFRAITQDIEGNYWIGSSSGLIKFNAKNRFIHYYNNKNVSNSLNSFAIYTNDSLIFLSNSRKGVLEINNKLNGYKFSLPNKIIKSEDNQLISNQVNSICEDFDKNIWYSTFSGITKYNSKKKTYTHFTAEDFKSMQINYQINSSLLLPDSSIWFGTQKGIFKYKNGKFTSINDVYKSLKHKAIIYLYIDSDNTIWATTINSLLRIKNKELTEFNSKNGFVDSQVNSIIQDKYKNYWIATRLGLFHYNNNNFLNISDTFSCVFGSIYLLQLDDNNNLFVGTNNGLNKINLSYFYDSHKLSVIKLDKDKGFIGIETNRNATFKDKDGNLWFGTINGVTKYISKNDIKNNIVPNTFISNIKLNSEKDSLLKYSNGLYETGLPKDLRLDYDNNNITFKFISTAHKEPKNIKFEYKLVPLNIEWIPIEGNMINFPILLNNKYSLLVRSCNSDGIWDKTPVIYNFIVKPPFWKTFWFIGISILLFTILLYLLYKVRVVSLQRKQKELEKIVKERTTEIVAKSKEISEANEYLNQQAEELNLLNGNLYQQNEEITAQRDEIEKQKDIVEEIHNEISQSINYATRLQGAILSDEKILKKYVSEHFVLFKPKDKVSGDFYWWSHVENHTVITAADSTGHGVPGAFMSMLGSSFLREIVQKEYITHTGVILRKLRKEIIKSLKQTGEAGTQKDGMDMAIISIDYETNTVQFSGANNPLYILTNRELKDLKSLDGFENFYEIKPDKMPIAIYDKMDNFTTHEIQLEKGDVLYMFSDGYADQFGGSKGKKFKYKPFKQLLSENREKPMKAQKELLDNAFESWKGNLEQVDDVVVLGIKI